MPVSVAAVVLFVDTGDCARASTLEGCLILSGGFFSGLKLVVGQKATHSFLIPSRGKTVVCHPLLPLFTHPAAGMETCPTDYPCSVHVQLYVQLM